MFAERLLDTLHASRIRFVSGVPDSILKGFCAALSGDKRFDHVIAANEGGALGFAAGNHLATGLMPVVYLQNSGLANALNPYLSMCHPAAYDLPMILLVGWRGQPGISDEPQHRKVGEITLDLLRLMDIDVVTLTSDPNDALSRLDDALQSALERRSSLAIVVPKGILDNDAVHSCVSAADAELRRSDVIKALLANLHDDDVVFGGIGHVGRELYAERLLADGSASTRRMGGRDFLCVGGMGHAHQIAMGYARERRGERVWCLDGDGALLMHLGSLSTISRVSSAFVHILFDNGIHASVGGQPVANADIDYGSVARTLGYQIVHEVRTHEELRTTLAELRGATAPVFVWIRVSREIVSELPRPKRSLIDLKRTFWSEGQIGECAERSAAESRPPSNGRLGTGADLEKTYAQG